MISISSFLPSSETIVKQVIDLENERRRLERLEIAKESSPFIQLFKESKQKDPTERYLAIENYIRENGDKLPMWEVAGPLHYGMSLEKMKSVIEDKFKELAVSGKLMSEKTFLETLNRKDFYPKGLRGHNDLTRIWGAEFLKSHLQEIPSLNATDHYLIVDDHVKEIEIQMWHGDYPYLSIVKNAQVFSKKIEGERKAQDYRFSAALDKLKYRDFSDEGNIIKDRDHIGWVVDTEIKSFDPPSLSRSAFLIRNYLQKRFEVLSGNQYDSLYQTFKISTVNWFC